MSALAHAAPAPRLWRSAELSRHQWAATVPPAVIREAREFAAARPEALADLERLSLTALAWPRTRTFAAALDRRLWQGVGFSRVSLPRGHGLSPEETRLLFLALGAALGHPLTQYGRLYAVKDRGADYRASTAPVSMTSERTGFHTDSSARTVLPDYVGLLCERSAKAGGDSLVSNALCVREELERCDPEAMRILQRDHVRDLVTPGADAGPEALLQNRFPVFARDSGPAGWTFRYMRYWLERGQQKAGLPLPPAAVTALDRLDRLLSAPTHVLKFRLDAGEMFWINNRTLAHDRTAFADDPEAPRLLWRMWVGRRA